MSPEKVEAFCRAQAAYNRGDWDAALAYLDPDVEFDLTRAVPDGQTFRGYEGVMAFWGMLREVFGDWRSEADEIVDGDDWLFTRVRLRGKGAASGVITEDVLYQVMSFPEGGIRPIRVKYFRERAEALEAVGLAE